MSIDSGTSPVMSNHHSSSDLEKSVNTLCPPNILIPGILKYLSFADLVRVASVSKDWRRAVFERTDPRVFVAHAETAMRRHQRKYGPRINDLDANGRDSPSRKWSRRASKCLAKALHMNAHSLYLIRILHEYEKDCNRITPSSCYSSFLTKTIPVARAQRALSWIVPQVAREVAAAYKDKLSISFDWSPETDQADVARFLFCTATALALDFEESEFILTMTQHREKHREPLRLRLYFEKKSEYGVYMDPIHNTIHIASMDIRFLAEQIRNASRSLSRFNGVCGFCKSVKEVEEHGMELLQVSKIVRDPAMGDSEHAHCLFKLILYSKDLNNGLKGMIIQPSKAFGTTIVDNKMVVQLMWCASWVGNKNVHRMAFDMGSDDDDSDDDDTEILSDLDIDAIDE